MKYLPDIALHLATETVVSSQFSSGLDWSLESLCICIDPWFDFQG